MILTGLTTSFLTTSSFFLPQPLIENVSEKIIKAANTERKREKGGQLDLEKSFIVCLVYVDGSKLKKISQLCKTNIYPKDDWLIVIINASWLPHIALWNAYL